MDMRRAGAGKTTMAEAGNQRTRAPRAKPQPPIGLERIGAWLTLVANLGVLAGLVLVILQLSQNERMIRAQTRHEIADGIVELLADTAGNPHLADIAFRGQQGEALTPVEQFQFQLRIGALLRIWEDEHYQYRMGLYDEAEFTHERENWKTVLGSSPGLVALWCRSSGNYSAEFAAEVNGLLGPRGCEAARR